MIELYTHGRRADDFVIALQPELNPVVYLSNPRPDVLIWGDRVFMKDTGSGELDDRYIEAYAVAAFT